MMVIAFTEGSELVSLEVERRLKRVLQRLFKKESQIKCIFDNDTPFLQLCEWTVRNLQASCPEKEIVSIGVYAGEGQCYAASRIRFTSVVHLPVKEDMHRWVIDQADYVVTYIDLLLCKEREDTLTYQYALSQKHDCCINLCMQEDLAKAREKISSLVWWERIAILGRLHGKPKVEIAKELGVSLTTVRTYETNAVNRIIQILRLPAPSSRQCAVFGFMQTQLSKEKMILLNEALNYLRDACGVTTFLVSLCSTRQNHDFASILHRFQKLQANAVHFMELQDYNGVPATEQGRPYVSRILAERRALIDSADIVLCDLKWERRSGLLYARRKRVPVINLDEILKDNWTRGLRQVYAVQEKIVIS